MNDKTKTTKRRDENIAGIMAQVSFDLGADRPEAISARETLSVDSGWFGFLHAAILAADVLTEIEDDNDEAFTWYDVIDEVAEYLILNPKTDREGWIKAIPQLIHKAKNKA